MNNNLLESLARTVQAYHNCVKSDNTEWQEKHLERIEYLTGLLPHGSGIDGNTSINLDKSDGSKKLVISSEYHYMDGNGFYAGWVYFEFTILASLSGYPNYDFTITQNDTDQDTEYLNDLLGDYICDTFGYALVECTPDR